MKMMNVVTLVLLIVGGLNWGVVAATGGNDLVTMLLGTSYAEPSMASRVVYLLVGLSAVYQVIGLKDVVKK